jgi:hypothetical protein
MATNWGRRQYGRIYIILLSTYIDAKYMIGLTHAIDRLHYYYIVVKSNKNGIRCSKQTLFGAKVCSLLTVLAVLYLVLVGRVKLIPGLRVVLLVPAVQ